MMTLDSFEQEPYVKRGPRPIKCKKCNCEYFEQIIGSKFSSEQSIVIGQSLMPISQQFYFIRCVKCSETYTPNVIITAQDSTTREYNSMLDQMEAPLPAQQQELPLAKVPEQPVVATKPEKPSKK